MSSQVTKGVRTNNEKTILWVQKKDDGVYLGSITGLILGLIAAIFVLEGNPAALSPTPPTQQELISLFFESFAAGLALKGVAEATTGTPKVEEDDLSILSAKKRLSEA